MATTMVSRILTLDIVRGVAVMGILAMNIYAFAGPSPMYFNPSSYGGDTGVDLAVWIVNFIFVDTKMRSLFSILFGASTLLVIERAQATGRSPFAAHYSRMIWLLLFGLSHFWFVWAGDILSVYAMTGLLLYLFRNRSVKVLRGWGIALFALSTLLHAYQGIVLQSHEAGASTQSSPRAEMLDEIRKGVETEFGRDPAKIREELSLYRSGYEPIMEDRFVDKRFVPFFGAIRIIPETLAMMLFGMALFRSGMLTGEWPRERYVKWLKVSWAVSIPPLAALVWWQMANDFDGVVVMGASMAYSQPFDLIMAFGWASLIILLAKRNIEGPLARRVAATGRMAFTNYLMTSLVMTTIFYGYGLGLFGDFGRAALYLFVFGMWGAMLLWSKPWLDRFHYGPFEWLWRSLARFKPQPMLKRPQPAAIPA